VLHSYMAALDFAMEPSFECADDEAGDVVFVCATCSIGGWDADEEYMACGLFPLSAGFGLEDIGDGERPVSKTNFPLSEFPIARLPDETNYHFCARVELAAENVVGSLTCASWRCRTKVD
jgi:hypothetical protein